ncbi:hypothetical protein [Jeotgalicoccus sp. WY2]|uniref:hypothetical protein n=1 Tax=Jeotgalicoccus sp. WY2 TaxID=2708346 RepID=UPI001BD1C82B|nr:hypothetical protein [Jeotgalicoccus sp. WY2]
MIIVDRCFSEEMQFIGQNFNLDPKISINQIDSNQFQLRTTKGRTLILKQHTGRTLSKYFTHDNKNRGFYSEKFNELLETHQIEFRQNSVECNFITSLIDDEKDLKNLKIDKNKITFMLDSDMYEIYLQKVI